MQPLTPEIVQAALAPLGIAIRHFEQSTATSQMAADNIGCALGQIIKSLCFIAGDIPLLVLASGDQRIFPITLAQLRELTNGTVADPAKS
jgi:prolyl-tRNA editing enzyme YbaK/EbsC (Cys-tRNA(Pro) deacylase)